MARNFDEQNIFNGSAAYDLYSSAAPQIERPGLPDEQLEPRKRRVKERVAVAPTAVIGFLAAACMLLMVIFGYVQLYEASGRVTGLQNELSRLQQEQIVLESQYESSIDLQQVEQRAAELGLALPTGEQIVHINLSGADRAEIYGEGELSFLERVFRAIESSASGLVEYLS